MYPIALSRQYKKADMLLTPPIAIRNGITFIDVPHEYASLCATEGATASW